MKQIIEQYGLFYLISQTWAITSIILFAISYIVKNKKVTFIFQTLGNFAVVLSFVFLSDIVGSISTGIATVRSFAFYLYSKNKKEMPWWLVIVFVALTLISALTGEIYWYTIMYCIALSIFTISMKMKDVIIMKYGFFIANVLYLIYSYIVTNYLNAVGKAIQLISLTCGLIILYKDKKRKRKLISFKK